MRRSLGISEPEAPRVDVTLMRRRHLRGVMAIERQVYSRPWSPNLFLAEMTEPNNRRYLVAKIDREIVGLRGADLLRRRGARHEHRRRSHASAATRWRRACSTS